MKYYAVIGRVEYDSEDTCLHLRAGSDEEARDSFVRLMKGRTTEEREVYVNYCIESKSSLKIWDGVSGIYL